MLVEKREAVPVMVMLDDFLRVKLRAAREVYCSRCMLKVHTNTPGPTVYHLSYHDLMYATMI